MYSFEFKEQAARELEKLPPEIRKRILEKFKFYSLQPNPLRFAQRLKDPRFGEYRFRIGDYRVLCDLEDHVILVLKVGHRKDVYR